MASEAGHEQGEGLLHGYDSDTFFCWYFCISSDSSYFQRWNHHSLNSYLSHTFPLGSTLRDPNNCSVDHDMNQTFHNSNSSRRERSSIIVWCEYHLNSHHFLPIHKPLQQSGLHRILVRPSNYLLTTYSDPLVERYHSKLASLKCQELPQVLRKTSFLCLSFEVKEMR